VNVVPRDVWCRRPGGTPPRIATPTPRLWLHHGATGTSTVDTACRYVAYHQAHHGWIDVGYSFLIAEGKVLEGRGAGRSGAHTRGDNKASHGICMVGAYESKLPSDADLDALVWLVRHGIRQGWWDGPLTGGHRDAPGANTSCPGTALWDHIPEINRRVAGDVEDDMNPDEVRQIVREELERAFDGRDYANDMGRLRRSVRAIGGKLGLTTEYDDPGKVDA